MLIILLITNPLMTMAETLVTSDQTTESDYMGPILNNIQLSTTDVSVGEEIIFTASVSDDLSGVSSVSGMMYLADRSNPYVDGARYIEFVYDPETTNWIGTYTVEENDVPGEWILQEIHMADNMYNSNWAYISESFTIHNDLGDFTAPIVENVVIDPVTANVGDVVNISMKVTDDKSEISYVSAYLQSTVSWTNRYVYLEYNQETDEWVGSYTVQKNDIHGLSTLMVDIQDTAGNYGTIDTYKTLYINNEDGDYTAPVIENIEISSSTIEVGETVTITADVSDDKSGVRNVYANLHSYNSNQYEMVYMNYDQELNKWVGTFTAKETTHDGDWYFNVSATDNYDNYDSIYSYTNFTVINPNGDYTAPTISNLEVNPTNVTVGEQVTLSLTVADDKSGVAYVQAYLDYLGNVPFKYDNESGKWTASVTIPDTVEDGREFYIHTVEAFDFKGNRQSEWFNQSFYVSNPTPLLLETVEFSSDTVKVGDSLQIQAKFANDDNVIKSIIARITDGYSINRYAELIYDSANNTWTGSYSVHSFDRSGEWYVDFHVKGVNGNDYYFSAEKAFTVDNPNGDTELPVIKNVTITPEIATFGDEVTIEVDATDIGSGISFVNAFFNMEYSGSRYIPLTLDQTTKKWVGKFTVEQKDASGIWPVEIMAADIAGNIMFDPSYQIEISNPNQDITGPTVESFSFDRTVAQTGETVHFKAKVSDNQSGISEVYAQISQYNYSEYRTKQVRLTYDETQDLWVGSYTIPTYFSTGLHSVSLEAVDRAGNYGRYWMDDDLLILNDTPDYEKPVLDELSFTPGTVKLGDTVSFRVKATDVGSNVESVSVTFMEGRLWNATEFGGHFDSIDLKYDPNENVWVGDKTITSVDYTGKWRIDVSAQDGAGNSVYGTFPQPLFVDLNETVTFVNLEVNQSSPQVIGTPIAIKATSEGSRNPEYRFYVRDERGELTTIQEYSSQDTITWTPTVPGDYTIIVHAKDNDSAGSASFYEARNEVNYKINVGKVTSLKLEANQVSPNVIGTPITVTATSEGSNETAYRFYVKDDKGVLTTLQEYSDNNTVTWTPTSAGNYTIIAHAKDKNKTGSKDFFEARTVLEYQIVTGKVTSVEVESNQPSSTIVGTPITLTAAAEGSNEPLYRFLVKDEKGNLTTLQTYSSNDTVTWTPTSEGSYTIIVHSKDKSKPGSGEFFEARTVMSHTVKAGKVSTVKVTSDLSAPQVAGTAISLKATSEGSNEPMYRFLVKDEKGTVTTLQTYSSNDTVTWTPTSAGSYTIIVHGKDKSKPGTGEFFEARAEMSYNVTVAKITSAAISAGENSPQPVGTPITFKASSQGSETAEYRFFARDNLGNLTTIQEYSSSNSVTWTPTKAGTYTIILHVKDKYKTGSYYFYDARAEMLFEVQ
jgi:hypothetical protein